MVICVLLTILEFAVEAFLGDHLVPGKIRGLVVDYSLSSERSSVPGFLTLMVSVSFVMAFLGMYWFKSWARTLSLINIPLVFLTSVAGGFFLRSGVGYGLAHLAALVWGVVLALAFFSSLHGKFADQ